jgi:hypothetical protein
VAAECLTKLGRDDEADAMVERGARRFPHEAEIVVAHVRTAVRHSDWPNALIRWEVVKNRFDNFLRPIGMAQSLREMRRFAEANEVAMLARDQFPTVPWTHAELARIASAEDNFEGVCQHWETARNRCPDFAMAHTAGAQALRHAGRGAEADKILSLGVMRLRYDLGVHLEFARSAHRPGDLDLAAERWSLVAERFPDCAEARERKAVLPAAAEPPGEVSPASGT